MNISLEDVAELMEDLLQPPKEITVTDEEMKRVVKSNSEMIFNAMLNTPDLTKKVVQLCFEDLLKSNHEAGLAKAAEELALKDMELQENGE